jgi:hypothetical protein
MSYLTTPGLVIQKVKQGGVTVRIPCAVLFHIAYSCVSTVSWTSDSD